jgi:hypothetical protein
MPTDESTTQQSAADTSGGATTSHDSVSIVIDVECPDCEYNLRGLPGPIVNCPECGLRSDVPVLAARQWNKLWYRAPGFNTLIWPAVWMWICFIIFTFTDAAVGLETASALVICLVVIVGWSWLMVRAYRLLGSEKGIWFALLMHLLVAGYLAATLGLIVLTIAAVLAAIDGANNAPSLIEGVLSCLFLLFIFWGCRRIERSIAGACIRHHLRRPTE